MRIVPIQEALAMDAGETVPSIRGLVTEVTDRISGKNKEGEDWAFQKIKVRDQTGEVTVKVWDRDAFPKTLRGQEIIVACNDGKNGLTGIKVKDDTYRGKTSKLLNVTPSAHVDPVGPEGGPAPETKSESEPTKAAAPATKSATPPAKPAAAPQNGNGSNGNGKAQAPNTTADIKRALNRMANLYLHCMNAADYVQQQWETSAGQAGDRVMTAEQHQACVSSMFIQACKSGFDTTAPTGPFNHKE